MFIVWSFLFYENTQKLQMLICVQTKYAMQKKYYNEGGVFVVFRWENAISLNSIIIGYEFKNKLAKICS
jgi:hypothetical protein